MTIYRLYAFKHDVVDDVAITMCDDDEQAVEFLKTWAKSRHVELWEADRLVARIAADGDESSQQKINIR